MSTTNNRTAELLKQYEAMQDFIEANGLEDRFEAFYAQRIDALEADRDLPDEIDRQLQQAGWRYMGTHAVFSQRTLVIFLSKEYSPELAAYAPVIVRSIEAIGWEVRPQ